MSICVTLLPSWDGQMVEYLYKSWFHKSFCRAQKKTQARTGEETLIRPRWEHCDTFTHIYYYFMWALFMTRWHCQHLHSRRLWRPGSRQTGQWLFSRHYPGEKNERKKPSWLKWKHSDTFGWCKLHVTRAHLIIVWPVKRGRATVCGRPGQYRTHLDNDISVCRQEGQMSWRWLTR